MQSKFDKNALHKVNYAEIILLYAGNEYICKSRACLYPYEYKCIEILLPRIEDNITHVEYDNDLYKIISKEQFSWRLHRLVCQLIDNNV